MRRRIYIAASSREMKRVREAQRLAALWGWELTLDWLTPMIANIAIGRFDADLSLLEQRVAAQGDLMAIDAADLVWLLAPREPTKGAWVELGYAYGTGTPVVVSGAGVTSIFTTIASYHVPLDADVGASLPLVHGEPGSPATEDPCVGCDMPDPCAACPEAELEEGS